MDTVSEPRTRWKEVASTKNVYSAPINQISSREANAKLGLIVDDFEPLISRPNPRDEEETNYFKELQWSPDGTSILTSSADNALRLFILPPDLLSTPSPHYLKPYTTYHAPEPTYAQIFYPQFQLSNPFSTLVLTSPRDHPLQLLNVLDPSPSPKSIATYPLINPTTEVFETPSSLLFHPSGGSFYTGTESLITLFDVSRPGEGPVSRLPTIPSRRHKMKGGGVGMRGVASCLGLQPGEEEGMLAAGTWTRWVSLYDAAGLGGTVANWSIASAADDEAKIGGAGVSQVLWSPCGRYLFVVERKSNGILIFDVRVSGKLVAWCEGRGAGTNQRMQVEVVENNITGGIDVWAGGMDGSIRVWRDVGRKEGAISPDESFQTYEDGTVVGGIGMHSCGSILATASGSRREQFSDINLDSDSENSDDTADDESDDEQNTNQNPSTSKSANLSHITDSMAATEPKQMRRDENIVKIWSLT